VSLVYLVSTSKDGRRCWFVNTDTRLNKYQQPIQVPQFDDENSKPVSLEFALDAREKWRREFGIECHIAIERYGPFIEDGRGPQAPEQDLRQPQFVPFTNDLGLQVTPAARPTGWCWAVRSVDIPFFQQDKKYTSIETIFGDTPEAAAQRAVDLYGQEILFANPNAIAEPAPAQKKVFTPGVRPGDR
jgi:hypothetical protein